MQETPWAVILVKLTDGDAEPQPKQVYKDLFTADNIGSQWNLVQYFKDWSHGTLDLGGSKVFGWYHVDMSVGEYNAMGGAARGALIKLARQAAIADDVNLSPFYSTVACANYWHDVGAADSGVVAQGAETLIQSTLAQELGHVYGLQHSRLDGSTDDYTDAWDVMTGNVYASPDPEFTTIGPGLNAANMRSRTWLDIQRTWKSSGDEFDQTITLRPLDRHDLTGYLAAELPTAEIVEFRVKKRWDAGIPRSAILVHRFAVGHSYLMRGNAGVSDLVAGDSFGSPEPEDDVGDMFIQVTGMDRMDVVSIDEQHDEAIIRVRHRKARRFEWKEIDPMSVILPLKAYLIWLEIHHPHEPKLADVQRALRALPPEQRNEVLAKARVFKQYAELVQEAIRKM
jgi:hypothetical protein